mmetsp:Transcript_67422/g.219659  ORF Transcript_67422/g.219659 Transcript_67422/m.219659 type:complete len:88 (-) Transcript_67422:324-587(-)
MFCEQSKVFVACTRHNFPDVAMVCNVGIRAEPKGECIMTLTYQTCFIFQRMVWQFTNLILRGRSGGEVPSDVCAGLEDAVGLLSVAI